MTRTPSRSFMEGLRGAGLASRRARGERAAGASVDGSVGCPVDGSVVGGVGRDRGRAPRTRAPSTWRALALALFALALVAGPAQAGSDQNLVVDKVAVRVRSPWPDMLTHGALPILIDATNSDTERRRLDVFLDSAGFGGDEAKATTSLVLEPGASVATELFVPVQIGSPSPYTLAAVLDDGQRGVLTGLGATQLPDLDHRNVLVVSARAPTAGEPGRWTSALSREAVARGVYTPSTPSSTAPFEPVRVTSVVHADLPKRPEGYASLDAVVIDAREGLPPPETFAPIAAHARTGGLLVFAGRGALELARSAPDVAPWLEERFEARSIDGVRAWLYAQGLVVVTDHGEPFATPQEVAALNEWIEGKGLHASGVSWVPNPVGDRSDLEVVQLAGLELPVRGLLGVLIAFAIVIGPVNLWYVRKKRRPALLLVTVPVLSIAFALVLFAYGALSQGLEARQARVTFTLLDQRAHRSTTAERREFFAGFASVDGLRPGPGASVWRAHASPTPRRGGSVSTLRFDGGIVLGGAFLPVRTPTNQTILVDRPARLRVDVRRDGAGWTVENGLGTRLDAFTLNVGDGELWEAQETVAPGGRATLRRVPGGRTQDVAESVFLHDTGGSIEGLPIGCYAARLASSPFGDDLGFPMTEESNDHRLVGVLDLAEVSR